MEHTCSQQKEIGSLQTNMELIIKEFFGNGREGMSTIIPRVETQLIELSETVKNQTTVLSALAKTVLEMDTINKYKKDSNEMSWKKAAVLISSILGACSILTAIIIKFI